MNGKPNKPDRQNRTWRSYETYFPPEPGITGDRQDNSSVYQKSLYENTIVNILLSEVIKE